MICIGDKFGRLTVIEETQERTSYRNKIWLCQCECGNLYKVPTASLTSGNTKSCGCLQKDTGHINGKKNIHFVNQYVNIENIYDLSGDYGICTLLDGITTFLFDKEDYDLIKRYKWTQKKDGLYSYIVSQDNGKTIRLHRLIMNCLNDKNLDVDHINHNVLDNRKQNLRKCYHFENIIASKTYSNNTSGRKGVYWDKSRNKWMVMITVNKHTYHLGRYDNFEDAVRVREDAEKKYHKEFHYDEN